jgi:hypothetical protein
MTTALIAAAILYVLFESVSMVVYGNHCFIRHTGVDMLKEELSDARLNTLNENIISLNSKSTLKGWFISKQSFSLLFPYYLSSVNGNNYGVLIFSKSYFLVKQKYREFNKDSERVKF